MNLEQLRGGLRYRKEAIRRTLAQSIEEVGLHPVVVTPEGRLIAGQRRLGACRLCPALLLDWLRPLVVVVGSEACPKRRT